jgi:hypothetical protein
MGVRDSGRRAIDVGPDLAQPAVGAAGVGASAHPPAAVVSCGR